MVNLSLTDHIFSIERARITALLMLLTTVICLSILYLGSHGTIDSLGRPVGTDFSNVWTAGHMANSGHAADAWNWTIQHDVQKELHGDANVPFYGWHYPPLFLLVASFLSLFPYLIALTLWQISTLALCLWLIRTLFPEQNNALLIAAGAPIVFICLAHGQNGFLTAALLGGGLMLLDKRPWLAGVLLGALVYKPQFAVLIPILILARGQWRAFLSAGLTVTLLCLTTIVIWGWPVWQAFFESLPLTQHIIIEAGATGWERIQSPFAAIRQWGGSIGIAYAVQMIFALTAIALAACVAHKGSMEIRAAAGLSAALLCTPYVLDYDHVLLGVAIAFLAADLLKRGVLRHELTWLTYAWVAPLCGRSISMYTHIPMNLIAAVAILAITIRRAAIFDDAFNLVRPKTATT